MASNLEGIPLRPPQADHDNPSSSAHLWFPEPEGVVAIPQASGPSSQLRDRLYIGNLHPTVNEYALLQVFIKFGKVSKLDFLFHKTGPNKGQPRGYVFIQYFNESDAQVALENVNGKLLRGQKLSVTFAHQAPLEQRNGSRQVARRIDARPTFLSMIKSGTRARTDNKIAMMEAKLRQMESSTTSSSNSLPPKSPPSAALLNSASRQCRGLGVSLSSRNPAGPTVQRPTTLAEPTTHLGLSADADTTPSASLPTLNTQPEVLNPSMSCKGILPGVKIVKERHK